MNTDVLNLSARAIRTRIGELIVSRDKKAERLAELDQGLLEARAGYNKYQLLIFTLEHERDLVKAELAETVEELENV